MDIRNWVAGVAAAAIAASVSGCEYKPTSTPEPGTVPAPDGWVVESVLYARDTDTHSVICVPAADLELPDTERTTWQEYVTNKAAADAADWNTPCPGGVPR